MKFVCDQCHTKYSIADERVQGRVLKIRCKSCNNVITVREEVQPVARAAYPVASGPMEAAIKSSFGEPVDDGEHTMVSSGPLPGMADPYGAAADVSPGAGPGAQNEWYVSFDGDQEGPYPLDKACDRVRAERPRGKEVHCWRPGFFVWLPIEEVPEFGRVLNAAKPPPPMPKLPAVPARTTGSRPALRQGSTGAQKALKEQAATGPKASVPRDPTGPRAALGVSTPALGPSGAAGGAERSGRMDPPVDSKPIPLPPPPEALRPAIPGGLPSFDKAGAPPSGPMGHMDTKPEPRLYRRATEAAAPAMAARARGEGPNKHVSDLLPRKPLESSRPSPSPDGARKGESLKKQEPANGREPPRPSLPPDGARKSDEASPFAAALAASAGNAPKDDGRILDTGPVPLPPPPGDDLPIGDASGLLNLSHLTAPGASGVRVQPRGTVETFGGVTVTPAPARANGATPPPVVVMAGPAPRGSASWVKWAALGGIALSLVLGGTLIYVVVRQPAAPAALPVAGEPSRKVDDQPIAVADPSFPTQPGATPPRDGKRPIAVAGKRPVAHPGGAPSRDPKDPSGKLSAEQRSLAALYNDSGNETRAPHGAPTVAGPQRSGGQQVSQSAIMGVVTQNRRSLNLCYDRVLKHDSSIKRARLDMHVKIGISGTVTAATPAGDQARGELGTCIAQTVKHWRFPSSGEEYETEFPIILQAD